MNTPPPAAQTKTPAPPKTPAPRKAPQGSSTPSFKPHAGHAALLIGAAAFLILLALATSLTGTPLKALAVALAIIGAFGVYRCSTDLEIPMLGKVFLTAVALLPIAGSFVCIMVLLWLVRRWQEPS